MAGKMDFVDAPPDTYKNWDKSGKNEFFRLCKHYLQGQKDSPTITVKGQVRDLKRIFHELCWQALKNTLMVEQVVTALADVMTLHPELPSLLTDIISVIDIETQCEDDRLFRDKFLQLVGTCVAWHIIPEKVIKERLDGDTAAEAGIIKVRRLFNTKFIKLKTKLFYKQHKFNLLREECEGYAKLITELNQDINGSVTPEYLLEVIKSLIGCFNLDPNRVLDIMLDSFEYQPELKGIFIPLLKSYMCDEKTLSEVLGFKLKFYQKTPNNETPKSLYTITALMLQYGLISLDSIYGLLKPNDSEMIDHQKKELQEARLYARKLNMVTTSSEKTADKEEDTDGPTDKYASNQKLGLFEALLRIGDWKHAQMIINRLPDHYASSFAPICSALCSLIHYAIEPLYRKHNGLPRVVKQRQLPTFDKDVSVKQVETFNELRLEVVHMLSALGPQLHMDPMLMGKIIRLGKSCLTLKAQQADVSVPEDKTIIGLEYNFLTILDEVLLPSLTLLESNCCMAEELWGLLRLYSYQHRYRLYGQWKNETYQNHPLLIRTKADRIKKTRYIMKRLSKENVKQSGRHIGKLSHSSPGFLFDYILSQIQTWNNLIAPVVDSLKYLTGLSYDVLAYCIIEALANPEKDRMKHDGTTISLWLQSLSNFCGAVFKKYSIDLTGLLQYVANQLKAEKSLDLLILKEVVQKMAGIEALEEMTVDQLEAMSGGELLRAEGGYFSQIRNTKKSSQRLKDALIQQELAVPLCLMMAHQRNCIIYKEEENSHLKLVGKLYDQCQDTLVQFGSFLATNLSTEDYVKKLPSINALMSEYHIMSDVAFFLSRPMFVHSITTKFDEMRKQDKQSKNATSSQSKLQKYLDVVAAVMNPIIESVKPLHLPKVWEDISPQFYVTFWSLTMYDLRVPNSSYEKELIKLKAQITQIEDNKDTVQNKKKKEVDRCVALMDKMKDEEKKQKEHCERVLGRLQNEKDTWFLSRSAKNETITQFLQLCVFPRCTFTAMDAIYCAQFVHTIHNLKTPNFSTLICYDRIFCDITYTVTSCTENEANRYGRFLSAMLETVMRWHSDKLIFEKECANYPGFVTKFRVANQATENASNHVDYENYRHVCHKWHFKITKALATCLGSSDYVQIRNALIVLTKIIAYYPGICNLASYIENRIRVVRDEEKDNRPDLYALAVGYMGQLKAKKPTLIPEHEFHQKESKDVKGQATTNGVKVDPSVKPHNAVSAALKDGSGSSNAEKSEKSKDSTSASKDSSMRDKDRRPIVTVKIDAKSDVKSSFSARSYSSVNAKNSTGTVIKRELSSIKGISEREKDSDREKSANAAHEKFSAKMKEERNASNAVKEERIITIKDEKRDERNRTEKSQASKESRDSQKEKSHHKEDKEDKRQTKEELQDGRAERSSSATSSTSSSSHGQRKAVESSDHDRDVKRRKMDHPLASGKNARHEEKPKDTEKAKEKREKSRSREPDRGLKKEKDKEKKLERKRERLDDKEVNNATDMKRRKEEESGKSSRQNGETEKEHHRRSDDAPGERERVRERKGEGKEEKKHRRSSSAGNAFAAPKKR